MFIFFVIHYVIDRTLMTLMIMIFADQFKISENQAQS